MATDPRRATMITNAVLFDGSGSQPTPGTTVVIRGGRIEAVSTSPEPQAPLAVEVVDAHGMTLMPGLIDMHTHLLWSEVLPHFLAYGVTTVRDVGNDLGQVGRLAEMERVGESISPRIFFCGPPLEGDPPLLASPMQVVLSGPEDVGPVIDQLADAGACAVKLYMGITTELMSAAVGHARRRRLPVTAHLGRVNATTAAMVGLSGLEHVAQGLYGDVVPPEMRLEADDRLKLGLPRFWEKVMEGWAAVDLEGDASRHIMELLVEKQMYLVPTFGTQECKGVSAPEEVVPSSPLAIPESMRSRWAQGHSMMTGGWESPTRAKARSALEQMKGFVGRLHDAGGRVVAGSDVGAPYIVPGASLHRELELMVQAGLSEREALHAATGAAAAVLGQGHDLGTIERGKLADMILVDGDPCADISHVRRISAVFRGGELVPAVTSEQ